jgi:hypothetical protein
MPLRARNGFDNTPPNLGRPGIGRGPRRRKPRATEGVENRSRIRTYIGANRTFIPNYGDRYRHGETISTAFVESAINQVLSKRFVKRQQMRWTERGAHLLLQVRTIILNNDWRPTMSRWYPRMGRNKRFKSGLAPGFSRSPHLNEIRCPFTSLVISNIEKTFLPSNTANSLSSARMLCFSLGSWSSRLRMYSQSFLVSSLRGSGSCRPLRSVRRRVARVC